MFQNCINLSKLEIDNFNTKNCAHFNHMFQNCKNLKEIKINHFNVENALVLCNMFENCESLTELNLSNFKTKLAINMSDMFKNCKNLKKLDISNITCEKIFMLTNTFKGLDNLVKIKAPLSIEIAKIYKNEININNIIYTDLTPLKAYRKSDIDIFSNAVKIIEVDAKTKKEKILFESDIKTFTETPSELYGKFAL